jgi:hypothetical protein
MSRLVLTDRRMTGLSITRSLSLEKVQGILRCALENKRAYVTRLSPVVGMMIVDDLPGITSAPTTGVITPGDEVIWIYLSRCDKQETTSLGYVRLG